MRISKDQGVLAKMMRVGIIFVGVEKSTCHILPSTHISKLNIRVSNQKAPKKQVSPQTQRGTDKKQNRDYANR